MIPKQLHSRYPAFLLALCAGVIISARVTRSWQQRACVNKVQPTSSSTRPKLLQDPIPFLLPSSSPRRPRHLIHCTYHRLLPKHALGIQSPTAMPSTGRKSLVRSGTGKSTGRRKSAGGRKSKPRRPYTSESFPLRALTATTNSRRPRPRAQTAALSARCRGPPRDQKVPEIHRPPNPQAALLTPCTFYTPPSPISVDP
jgi:hypothetical protein